MKYINVKNGAVIESASVLGGAWKPVEEKKPETAPAPVKKKTTKKKG